MKFTTGHIGLNVTDLDRSLPFYQRVFGFEALAEGSGIDRRWVFLGQGGNLVLTLWQQSRDGFSATTAGLHHLSFQVDTRDDLAAAEAILRELGTELTYDGVVAHADGAESGGIFFTDPDGVRLEIFIPAGAEGAPAPAGEAPTCGFF
ncbi:VOC family protein [Actinoplanes sichuanensis]|uniref:VOC family protein n=1 Tax=Actinoplanes sichuanensis TaxID=512349 RepID=A0ABW4AIJ8_9ACTN|nr:VOC family protein [Actinoplanes sichuanensis]BEL04012.1 VOC family protein [Actinoplanes sichuanensis]